MFYDHLLMFGPNNEPEPLLAQSWESSPDGYTWTFHLVKNATWWDGVPLTADDVVFSVQRFQQVGVASAMYSSVQYIDHAEAPDPYTVVFILREKAAPMLSEYFIRTFTPIPKHIWESIPVNDTATFRNEPPVGSGPFKFDKWTRGEAIEVVANDNYWHGRPGVDRIVIQWFTDMDTAIAALKTGAVDAIGRNIPDLAAADLEKTPNIVVDRSPSANYIYMSFDVWPNSPNFITLGDRNVRLAMLHAVDKQRLNDVIHLGQGKVAVSLISPASTFWFNPNIKDYEFNLTLANDILDKAGYTTRDSDGTRMTKDGKNKLEYTLDVVNSWPAELQMGNQVAEWYKEIGIKLNVRSIESLAMSSTTYPKAGEGGSYDLQVNNWNSPPDPDFILGIYTTDQIGINNECGWSNSTYDQLYLQQRGEMDATKRQQIVWQMQEIYHDAAINNILYFLPWVSAYRTDKFEGFFPKFGGVFNFPNRQTFLGLHPKGVTTITTAPMTTATTEVTQAPDLTPYIAGVVILGVLVAAAVLFMRRRKTGTGSK
jgi:peptide/nickel transport system substrate-binding protein